MYFNILNIICYEIIGYLLLQSGMTVDTLGFWGVMIIVLVIQVMTSLETE